MTISEGYGSSDVKSLMSALCSHADSMRECGRVLAAFCADFSAEVAAAYIRDVMSLQFVNELDGKLGDMLDELPDIRSAVEEALEGVLQVDKHGRVLPADSDADSDGNLRYFLLCSPLCVFYFLTGTLLMMMTSYVMRLIAVMLIARGGLPGLLDTWSTFTKV